MASIYLVFLMGNVGEQRHGSSLGDGKGFDVFSARAME